MLEWAKEAYCMAKEAYYSAKEACFRCGRECMLEWACVNVLPVAPQRMSAGKLKLEGRGVLSPSMGGREQ